MKIESIMPLSYISPLKKQVINISQPNLSIIETFKLEDNFTPIIKASLEPSPEVKAQLKLPKTNKAQPKRLSIINNDYTVKEYNHPLTEVKTSAAKYDNTSLKRNSMIGSKLQSNFDS